MKQLPLPIDWRSRGQQSSIVIGEGNREALDLLANPQLWPSHCVLLVGPSRSGRTTIGQELELRGFAQFIDDAEDCDEAALFHRWNGAREAGSRLILAVDQVPPQWAIQLPDLKSRLATAGVARIGAPDEAMVEAMIAQGLDEAGTAFGPDVPRYLAPRLPRCYQHIEAAIVALNDDSLSSVRKISLPRARQVLEGRGLLSSE